MVRNRHSPGEAGTGFRSRRAVRPDGLGQRIQAAAHGAVGVLPSSLRARAEAQYQSGNLSRLAEVMMAWSRGDKLGQAEFAERFFGRAADDPVVGKLRDAARAVASASSHAELRGAAEKIGEAMQIVGLDRWPRVLADAEARARDPETVAAIENSRQPADVSKDAIRPVYPVETLLGIAAIGLESGAVAGLRASGGAILKPFLPESSLPIGDGATKRVGENAELENSASTKQIDEKAKLETAGSPVQLDKGQQGKHIAESNNYDPTRSTLTADPRELLKRFAGRGEKRGHTPVGQPGSKEAFDTGTEVIGINRSRSGISAPTTRGVIHYSKRGAHVVPATPRK